MLIAVLPLRGVDLITVEIAAHSADAALLLGPYRTPVDATAQVASSSR